jgi:predicted CoA-binding protein
MEPAPSMIPETTDRRIESLLTAAKNIAIVGLSPKLERPSNMVARYLIRAGYRITGVNPGQQEILGLPCYPDLESIPHRVDIVDIFRRSEAVMPIVEQSIAIGAGAVWMQLGIVNQPAARSAAEHGLDVVMDRCIKLEHARLLVH